MSVIIDSAGNYIFSLTNGLDLDLPSVWTVDVDLGRKAIYSVVKMYINPSFLEPELDLHRLNVDEAFLKVDDFLYEAYTARMFSVRIVHGKGTGALRNALRNYLTKHHLVKSFRLAIQGEGGGGVTVVKLVDK